MSVEAGTVINIFCLSIIALKKNFFINKKIVDIYLYFILSRSNLSCYIAIILQNLNKN